MARFNLDDYVDVAERIEEFYDRYPNGKIITNLLNVQGWNGKQTQFIVQASLYDDKELLATGLAEESLGGSGANLTAALENAETSAIGRATSNLNFATTRSGKRQRATRQEMEKVARAEANPAIKQITDVLRAKFELAADRKAFIEATVGRDDVKGISSLSAEETQLVLNALLIKTDKE